MEVGRDTFTQVSAESWGPLGASDDDKLVCLEAYIHQNPARDAALISGKNTTMLMKKSE